MHYSYDELLRLTRYLTGSQQAVNEQFKRMIFNIVGRNQDDHAKNFAFMMDKNGIWNLSPAYDITYSNGTGYTKNHQLSLNGKTNDFTLNDILQLAKKHSIKENIAKEYLEQIVEVFSKFKNKAKEIDVNEQTYHRIYNELRLNFK
jgi:serine/threonine-protein kinase HipA